MSGNAPGILLNFETEFTSTSDDVFSKFFFVILYVCIACQDKGDLGRVLLIDMEYVQQSFIQNGTLNGFKIFNKQNLLFHLGCSLEPYLYISLGFYHTSAFSFTKTFPVFGKKNADSINHFFVFDFLPVSQNVVYNLFDCISKQLNETTF